jgi:FKBP-type peptidyl-prolyl cis-trans isomerase SlyD
MRVKYALYFSADHESMSDKITKNKFVSLTYTITDEEGSILERIDMPIQYIQGVKSQVIEKIETALEGHQAGDLVQVSLSPEEGFGAHQPELTFSDDIANVPPQFHSIGAEVEFQNDHGESKIFRVTKIEDGKLTVDGNHPFAGKTITYNITVAEVRDATADELKNGVENMNALH